MGPLRPATLTATEPEPISTPATPPVLKVRIPDVHAAMQVLARRPDDCIAAAMFARAKKPLLWDDQLHGGLLPSVT